MADVTDISGYRAAKDNGGWMAGAARCTACGHSWAAVAPGGTHQLECPECRTHNGLFMYPASRPDKPMLTCRCGSQAMVIYDDGSVHCFRCAHRLSVTVEHSDV